MSDEPQFYAVISAIMAGAGTVMALPEDCSLLVIVMLGLDPSIHGTRGYPLT